MDGYIPIGAGDAFFTSPVARRNRGHLTPPPEPITTPQLFTGGVEVTCASGTGGASVLTTPVAGAKSFGIYWAVVDRAQLVLVQLIGHCQPFPNLVVSMVLREGGATVSPRGYGPVYTAGARAAPRSKWFCVVWVWVFRTLLGHFHSFVSIRITVCVGFVADVFCVV